MVNRRNLIPRFHSHHIRYLLKALFCNLHTSYQRILLRKYQHFHFGLMGDFNPQHNEVFLYAGPVKLVLCLLILCQNTLIVSFYFRRREKLSSLLFMLMALSDIVLACNEIADITIGLLCYENWQDGVKWGPPFLTINLVYPTHFVYFCSVYYNTVLTVVRSLSITKPFYCINTTAVRVSLLIGTLITFAITVADCFLTAGVIKLSPDAAGCDYFWASLDVPDFLSALINLVFYPESAKAGSWVSAWPTILPYSLASAVILVSMVIQVLFIRQHHDSEQSDVLLRESEHAATTIVLISLLFFLCNTAVLIFLFVPEQDKYFIPLRPMLPLINAAGYPLILIIRGSELKRWIKEKFGVVQCRNEGERSQLPISTWACN